LFRDRADAAAKLAALLAEQRLENPFVLGIPRGGAPIGRAVADALSAPFSVYISRKIGAPGNPEFGIGAVAEDGSYLLDSASVEWTSAKPDVIEQALLSERLRCDDYVRKFRAGKPLAAIIGKVVIICDDGLATGITMLAAVAAIKKCHPDKIIAAAPVASVQAARSLKDEGAIVVACSIPSDFHAVAQFYECFDQLTDEDVIQSLDRPVLYNS
jgi:predicted phosphoribosyltransferase